MKQKLIKALLSIAAATLFITGCRKRDAVEADNFVVFESAAQGMTAAEKSITVRLKLSRNTDRENAETFNQNEQGEA